MQSVNIKMESYSAKSKILHFLIVILIFAFFIFNFSIPDANAAIVIQAPKYIGLNSGLVGYWSF